MKKIFPTLIIGYSFFFIFAQFVNFGASAQTPDLNFRYLTTRDGLSQDDVRCIYQDRDGFMWFGTTGGVDRYDGRNFDNYYEFIRDTAVHLSQNTIGIYEDSYQGIWFINDTNGLVLMNKLKETFVRFRHDAKNPGSLANNKIRGILEDSEKNLWFTSNGGGLFLFQRDDSTFIRYQHDSTDRGSIGSNNLTSIAEDHKGIIWLTSPDGFLIRFDPQRRTFENIRLNEGFNFYYSGTVNFPGLHIDIDNQVWYLSGQDIYRYNPANKSIRRFVLRPKQTGTSFLSYITSMLEVEKEVFLLTTFRNGLYLFNARTGQIINYSYNPANPYGLNSNRLSQIFRSRDGVVWIGSFENGISIYSKNAVRFPQLVNLVDLRYLSNSNFSTYSLCEAPDGQIMMGTENSGLFLFNPGKNSILSFLPELSNFSIFDLYRDGTDIFWICTWRDGLYRYEWNNKRLKRFDQYSDVPFSSAALNAVHLMKDTRNRLWFATITEGVIMVDPGNNSVQKFSHHPSDTNTLSSNLVFKIMEDSRGNIWVGTGDGLNLYNSLRSSFTKARLNDENGKEHSRLTVTDIFEDSKKHLWIASSLTLHELDRNTGSFRCYPLKVNDAYIAAQKILEDRDHFLWIGTSAGIARFNPRTGSFKEFGMSDGISYLNINPTAGVLSRDGRMYFGTSRGVTVFSPEQIIDDTLVPPVFITGLSVNDRFIRAQAIDEILSNTILYTDQIRLNHKQSTLSISFAALNYTKPDVNQYLYKLEGFDKGWVDAGNSNRAYYANLPPGKYTFKVMAANSHGYWNNKGKQLIILIKPPFWQTWLFRVVVILAAAAIALIVHLSRVRQLRNQKKNLEGLVNERTSALNKANAELSRQHTELIQQHEEITSQNDMLSKMSEEILIQNAELEQHRSHLQVMVEERTRELEIAVRKAEESDKLKSAFLANMSHEIRTPMNAIVGFANLLKEDNLDPAEKHEFIEIINANSEILLVLIDDILDLSLIEADQLSIRKEMINLNEILDHLYSALSLINRKDDLSIRLNNELHHLDLKIESDRIRIKQILSNLMNNAYKFTDKGFIELGLKKKDDHLVFYVKDTGIGIKEGDRERIFERFRKSETQNNTLLRGTGLGLAISIALAKLLGGNLKVESTFGHGSVFCFSLPYSIVTSNEPVLKVETAPKFDEKWSGKNVLIVEDERANYLYVNKILLKMDVHVHWAENGLEAVKLVSSGAHFDLILMDIKMPVMDGFEATKIIKSNNPKQVVIALTAYARPEDRIHFMKAGFEDYLSKPIKPNDFIGVIRRYI